MDKFQRRLRGEVVNHYKDYHENEKKKKTNVIGENERRELSALTFAWGPSLLLSLGVVFPRV